MLLNEMYDDDLDEADRWLAKYTYEGFDKWPGEYVQAALLKRYPVDKEIRIYRGMNFDTKEQWDEFVAKFKAEKGKMEFGSISSWSPSETTAKQFAVTKPTYFLNAQLGQMHDQMHKEREYIAGYRGVILTMVIQPGQGIDVRKAKSAKEDEIILIAGTYQMAVHKEVKKFAHSLADRDETLETVLDKYLDIKNLKQYDKYYEKFYEHVLHHYGKDVAASDAMKQKVWAITFSHIKQDQTVEDLIKVVVDDGNKFMDNDATEITIHFNRALFHLQQQGFVPDDKMPIVSRYADKIVKAYAATVQKFSGPDYKYNMGMLDTLRDYVSDPSLITKLMQKQIGQSYHKVNSRDNINRINQIKDPEEKRKAISDYTKQIMSVMQQLQR